MSEQLKYMALRRHKHVYFAGVLIAFETNEPLRNWVTSFEAGSENARNKQNIPRQIICLLSHRLPLSRKNLMKLTGAAHEYHRPLRTLDCHGLKCAVT